MEQNQARSKGKNEKGEEIPPFQLFKITITPLSPFGIYPRGDLIFGHFLYYYFLLEESLLGKVKKEENSLSPFENYTSPGFTPPVIFSDWFPKGCFPFPSLPLSVMGVDENEKKEIRKINFLPRDNFPILTLPPKKGSRCREGNTLLDEENWCKYDNFHPIDTGGKEQPPLFRWELRVRNSLNRLTSTTGEGFSPFPIGLYTFYTQLEGYILVDSGKISHEKIKEILEIIGESGFGRRSSIGFGRFKIERIEEINLSDWQRGVKEEGGKLYYLALSPSIFTPEDGIDWENSFYTLRPKLGKFHLSSTPFKLPVLMADTGAVYSFEGEKAPLFLGVGAQNSPSYRARLRGESGNPEELQSLSSLVQGYTLLYPFRLNKSKESQNGK